MTEPAETGSADQQRAEDADEKDRERERGRAARSADPRDSLEERVFAADRDRRRPGATDRLQRTRPRRGRRAAIRGPPCPDRSEQRALDVTRRGRVRAGVGRKMLERVLVAVRRVRAVDVTVEPVVDDLSPARSRRGGLSRRDDRRPQERARRDHDASPHLGSVRAAPVSKMRDS
jgi:hypothetical protein